ncbi:hypothetical protein LSTR_LSTR003976 [Laodelphax striatellus]|uniref:Uncharacterized protein n=1 Tax=Laodelphax striatellus TaxID=195883 RepID=A0A482WF47_LAOST|nr:hypothetical protein LSTR_LSTR003976 [Laodelphax striatellus]
MIRAATQSPSNGKRELSDLLALFLRDLMARHVWRGRHLTTTKAGDICWLFSCSASKQNREQERTENRQQGTGETLTLYCVWNRAPVVFGRSQFHCTVGGFTFRVCKLGRSDCS